MITKEDPANFLSFSAGTASSAILWMVLKGVIPRPDKFYVLNADPGMEDYRTYDYVKFMEDECVDAGIEFIRCSGGDLYADLVDPERRKGKTRIDNPPFWTINPVTGKKGRLRQKCTGRYKIGPMDRHSRVILERDFGISRRSKRIPEACVSRWIGFTLDEWHRCSETGRKYSVFKYPLIGLGMTKPDILKWMADNNLPVPPRSVCIGCYANDLDYFKLMSEERPDDFERACVLDACIRDMTQFGITDICYVSSSCIPLSDLRKIGFKAEDQKDILGCHSGYCFT